MIEIVPYDPWWPARFEYVKANRIRDLGGPISSDGGTLPTAQFIAIEHVGSTSIPGFWAKPKIDILIVISDACHFESIHQRLIWGTAEGGYKCIGDCGVWGRWSLKLEHVRPARHQ